MKEHVRLCFECKSLDHITANCPYKSDNEEDKKKKDKKKKEKKKEKKMTFKKKRRKVAMWSLGIAIAPMIVMMMVQVMMTRGPSRRHLQASPSTISHPSSTLLRYALWQSSLR
jgi:polyferredoxin